MAAKAKGEQVQHGHTGIGNIPDMAITGQALPGEARRGQTGAVLVRPRLGQGQDSKPF